MHEVRLRVSTTDAFFSELKQIAVRIDAGDRTPTPAVIAFEKPEYLFRTLTANRWALLSALRASGPSSIRALAGRLGRDYRGVHADVCALLAVGLIEKNEAGRILVPYARIVTELSFEDAA